MKLLIVANLHHEVSVKLIKFIKLKKIKFDLIDTSKIKRVFIKNKYDYLISFLNPIYINAKNRKKIKKNSFNFHPGPPEYPGFGCYNFALLDETKFYGSTVHLMNDKFDNGKIVDVKKFKITHKNISLENLIFKTHKNLLNQGKKFILQLLNSNITFKTKYKWPRKAITKKNFERARQIKFTDSKVKILKKIRAFSYKDYGSVYLKIKGLKLEIKS